MRVIGPSREQSLRLIRQIEANPATLAQIILQRATDPRWRALKTAYWNLGALATAGDTPPWW